MITQDNLKFAFDNLNKEEIQKVMDSNFDYLKFEISHFNTGSVSNIEACDYSEETEQELSDNGNMLIDKDDFLILFEESESVNPFLIEYI